MLKPVDFNKNKIIAAAIGLLFVLAVGGMLLSKSKELYGNNLLPDPAGYNAQTLFKNKSAYVGDNSKVATIIDNLPYADLRKEVSLQTETAPYGITVNYDFNGAAADAQRVKWVFRNNAVVLFALIDNADVVNFFAEGLNGQSKYRFTRDEMQKEYQTDLRKNAGDLKSFDVFLRSLTFRLRVFPEKYAATMSSIPGIRIGAEYLGPAGKVRYAADGGSLFTWDIPGGGMSKGESTIELPCDIPAYWSPIGPNGQSSAGRNSGIKVALLDDAGNKIDEKKLAVIYDGSLFYSVRPSPDIVIGPEALLQTREPKDLNEAVSRAIKSRRAYYGEGETAVEGHVVLAAEDKNGIVKVYAMASFGAFGFENGIFTKVSGSGAIPTVITFSKNEKGEYSMLGYKEPMDGAYYADSTKKMFPKELWDKVFAADKYPDLVKQQELQAATYLRGIGRQAKVSAAYVEKKLPEIDVQASNKLFSEFTKYNAFLNNCPYWLGTRERIEDGARYIYETSQSKTSDGCDLITFRKKTEDGTIVEECKYKIIGGQACSIAQF